MTTLRVLMYSFKGGAGRTVSTANLAVLLAKQYNRRVTLVDLDVESAGTSVLFGLERESTDGTCWTIQDVLRGSWEPPPKKTSDEGSRRKETVQIDNSFEETLWKRIHRSIDVGPGPGCLNVLPARTILQSSDEARGFSGVSQLRFGNLIEAMELLHPPPELILFDSASGLQQTAHLGLMSCHVLVIFFRWTRQFMFGTTRFLSEYLCQNLSIAKRIRKVILVPTAVPRGAPGGVLEEARERRRKVLENEELPLINQSVRMASAKMPEQWASVHAPIYESDLLKWDDRILLLDETSPALDGSENLLEDYRGLATTLSDLAK